ncbi:UDP-GlcNAc:betaGal beta-1,3-N-acetylglucosaminyltransferase 7 isoform X2 [Chiloscyllium plagiosum]|uniref:UDP-GlcNAc:betaGal beta-1,3-N-acetylglucosaminyltransferase 7 isoform X2 n=1 Tax=Chiloscyllium plagiosum TaxID=36176 RepID=UPI001CB84F04|nr:UDP-GlcNAc:betaGal beta-1,3-N-acetylglucosaminyltransferase 7 isoform X2 [Chiloscyllium plagiosum]
MINYNPIEWQSRPGELNGLLILFSKLPCFNRASCSRKYRKYVTEDLRASLTTLHNLEEFHGGLPHVDVSKSRFPVLFGTDCLSVIWSWSFKKTF